MHMLSDVAEVVGEYLPMAHVLHATALAVEYVPATHARHCDCEVPPMGPNAPALQADSPSIWHEMAPEGEPNLQTLQLFEPEEPPLLHLSW